MIHSYLEILFSNILLYMSLLFKFQKSQIYILTKKLTLLQKFLKVFVREWCYTTNHKKLGLNYLLFAAISGLFGTTLSTLIRLELSQPGSLVFSNNANAYHVVMAMHAIIMVFFLVTPLFFGGFGNYFLPIHVGARDVAYPRLNNFSL
jgi:cytochrome c oxidase subunit 1